MIRFKCHVGVGSRIEGEALVASDDFSARYDLDRLKGVFSRPDHALAGQSYVDRILVLNTAKGGVASAWMLHEMQPGQRVMIELLRDGKQHTIALKLGATMNRLPGGAPPKRGDKPPPSEPAH